MKKLLLASIVLCPSFTLGCADGDLKPSSEKTCVDDATICTESQKCDQSKKECVDKDCTDEPKLCLPSQRCDSILKKCITKT